MRGYDVEMKNNGSGVDKMTTKVLWANFSNSATLRVIMNEGETFKDLILRDIALYLRLPNMKEAKDEGEIQFDKIQKLQGLEISLITSAKTDEDGFLLLKSVGFPFVG